MRKPQAKTISAKRLGAAKASIKTRVREADSVGSVGTPNTIHFARWPRTDELPGNADLIVTFHGLLSFSYTDQGWAEVGVFSHGQSSRHNLLIVVTDRDGTTTTLARDRLSQTGPFYLEVVGPLPRGVFSFQVGANFDRAETDDPIDFRWVLDLDGPDFYDEKIPFKNKNPRFYEPKLFLKSGTFYTLERTESTFKRVLRNGSNVRHLGRIAFCIAANVYLDTGQHAELKLKDNNGNPIAPFVFEKGISGQKIFFSNSCTEPNGNPCQDIDFALHFDSFRGPSNKRFDLEPVDKIPTDHPCARPHALLFEPSSDEAPCGGAGYGSGSGNP